MKIGGAYITSTIAAALTVEIMREFPWRAPIVAPEVLPFTMLLLFVTWLVTATLCALPALCMLSLVDRFGWRSPIYFIVFALIASVVLTTGLAAVMTPFSSNDPTTLLFADAVPRYLGWTLPSAVVGGLTYWATTRTPAA